MTAMITTPAEAIENIKRFESEVRGSSALQARLAYARAWYAHQNEQGQWCFGPSKFVGYRNLDAEAYLRAADENDGRRTEAQLQLSFQEVRQGTAEYDELNSALVAFLAKFGKAPSTKARINVTRGLRRRFAADMNDKATNETALVQVMIAAAKTLSTDRFRELRDELDGIWSS